jgi:hypothetical protein
MCGSEFLEEYLKRGFSEIVVLSHEHREETSGMQTEWTDERAAARKRGKYFEIEVHEKQKFGPKGGRNLNLSEKEISERQYKKLILDRAIIDTESARAELTKRAERDQRSTELYSKVTGRAPKCPDCGTRLVPRKSAFGMFWGCPSYPACEGKEKFSRADQKAYEDWRTL